MICEFRGGTYCSQVEAGDEVEAVRRWAEKIDAERPIPRVSGYLAKAALEDLEIYDLKPVALEGLSGVWCFSAEVGKDHAHCNMVLTDRPKV